MHEVNTLTQSIWHKQVKIPTRSALPGDVKADVAVIGAGMAGILTAHLLTKRGAKVVVLESGRIGGGQTQNTTAKITCQHNLIYHELIEKIGLEQTRQYAAANQAALRQYKEMVRELHIDCHFEEKDAYVYTTTQSTCIEQEVQAAQKLRLPAEFVVETDLPFAVQGAIRFSGQAQFNPLEFLRAIAEPLTIYEHTRVRSVENHTIYTDHGTVMANEIVVATHFPFINVPGFYFIRMHQQRSYVLALKNAANVNGMYIDADEKGFSFRNYQDLLLLGGAGHRCGENSAGDRYEILRGAAAQFFPGCEEVARWSAQDCMTLDGVPYIGRYALTAPHIYVATGFQKWGMTTAMAAAQILSDLIYDQSSPHAEVFSPQRFHLSASAKELAENTAHAFQGLKREFIDIPNTVLQALPVGHGGIVEHDGEKVGVYKKASDEVYIVSSKCTHFGCQLEWNPDERSWDCPCHGSRFDYKGNRLCGPAIENLPFIEKISQ